LSLPADKSIYFAEEVEELLKAQRATHGEQIARLVDRIRDHEKTLMQGLPSVSSMFDVSRASDLSSLDDFLVLKPKLAIYRIAAATWTELRIRENREDFLIEVAKSWGHMLARDLVKFR
jgi:hypothetical protein